MNRLDRKFFLGFIRIHILYHASKEKIYGAEMMEELKRHGYTISPGTLYPILHNLEKENLLKSEEENVEGKIRKYYKTTKLGKKTLDELKKKTQELIKEILEENT